MRRDEGLDLEDENTHSGLDSPKKQKQLILIRLIKRNLKFKILWCSSVTLIHRDWLPGFTLVNLSDFKCFGKDAKLGAKTAENEVIQASNSLDDKQHHSMMSHRAIFPSGLPHRGGFNGVTPFRPV